MTPEEKADRDKRRGHPATKEDLKYEQWLDKWAANPTESYSWYYLPSGKGEAAVDRCGACPRPADIYRSVKEAALATGFVEGKTSATRGDKGVYSVTQRGGRTYKVLVGTATSNPDGSMSVQLDSLPTGSLEIRDYLR